MQPGDLVYWEDIDNDNCDTQAKVIEIRRGLYVLAVLDGSEREVVATAREIRPIDPSLVRLLPRATGDAAVAVLVPAREPLTWEPTTAEKYDEMLNVLPPVFWHGGAFLVGEPVDHCHATGRARYEAYRQQGDTYVVSSRPVTMAELREALRG